LVISLTSYFDFIRDGGQCGIVALLIVEMEGTIFIKGRHTVYFDQKNCVDRLGRTCTQLTVDAVQTWSEAIMFCITIITITVYMY
jgi:hypothetical protein